MAKIIGFVKCPVYQPQTTLLCMQRIRDRSLDRLYTLEEELLSGKSDLAEVMKLLQVTNSLP